MGNQIKLLASFASLVPLVGVLQLSSCVSDDSDPGDTGSGGSTAGTASTGGSSSGSGGSSGSSAGSGEVPSGNCASPLPTGAFANFDAYDGSEFGMWSFAMGDDPSAGIFAGPFAYGDRESGFPETYEMGEGYDSTYAIRIADTMSEVYGGGMGLWLSGCVDGTEFTGISFWVRGSSPSPTATFTLSMTETQPSTPAVAGGTVGTCDGDETTCIHPKFAFPVTEEWTEVKVAWSKFMPGNAAGTVVRADGRNIVQVQWGVGLNFVPSEEDPEVYVPVPGAYELAVDNVSFY